jgi:hypothetical protein
VTTPNIGVLRSAIGPMLTDTGTISRQTGEYEQDEETGMEEPIYAQVYSGPVLVRPEPAVEVTIGGVEFSQARYDVTFPAETPVVVGDILVMGTVAHDPELAGQQIRLTDTPLDAWSVARFCKGERAT